MLANDVSSKTEKKFVTAALVGLLLGLPGAAEAQTLYNFTTVDVPLSPTPNKISSDTEVNGGSAAGIVGRYEDVGGIVHGFMFNGSIVTVDAPNSTFTFLNGINSTGQITGTYLVQTGSNQASKKTQSNSFFLSSVGSSFVQISPPGTIHTQAGNINASGEVVGSYRTSDAVRHGFLWKSTSGFTMTPFNNPADGTQGTNYSDVPPNGGTVPMGINDLGAIVGDYVDVSDMKRHGFFLSNGTYTQIDPPGSRMTIAEGVNNFGVIVGVYIATDGSQNGFICSTPVSSSCVMLNVNGALKTEITSIDQNDVVVGYYLDKSNSIHGFIGSPQ